MCSPSPRDPAPSCDPEPSPDARSGFRSRAVGLLVVGLCLASGTCGLAADLARSPLEHIASSAIGIQLFFGFAALAGAALAGKPAASRLGLGPGGLPFALVLLAALGTVGLSHTLDSILSASGLRDASVLAELDTQLHGARGIALLLAIIGLGFAPGISEEMLCRGLLQRGLVRRYGGPLGVGISALLFGAMHLEWVQGTAAALLGVYLGTVAHRAGSIRPAIFCHCCNNLVALAFGVSGAGQGATVASAGLGFVVAATAFLALLQDRSSS